MQGYLALDGDTPVGWCGAAPRRLLHALDDEPTPDADDGGHDRLLPGDAAAGAARGSRGRCSTQPAPACASRASRSPKRTRARTRKTPAENHFGPLALYLSAGFTCTAKTATAASSSAGPVAVKPVKIEIDDLSRPRSMRCSTSTCRTCTSCRRRRSVHALDLDKLRQPGITFWTAWDGRCCSAAAR
jgi:hypothetical protein